MGTCICPKSSKIGQKKNNGIDDHIKIDTDDFNEADYPVFYPDFYSKKYKNIQKVYTEITIVNYALVFKVYKIFITLNFKQNISTIVELEKVYYKGGVKKHLKKQEFKECNMEQMSQFIEKYNSAFDIDSSSWFKSTPTTDIFIRSEKNEKNKIKTLSMFYEKKGLNLKYNTTNFEKVKIPNEERNDIKPNKVVEIYNNCKKEFQYDNNLENFYFDGNISENNYDYSNYIIQVQNNNILFNNNNYNNNYNQNNNNVNNFV